MVRPALLQLLIILAAPARADDPATAAAWRERGELRLAAGQAEAALADLRRAEELGDRTAGLYLARGRAQLALGKPAEARADFEEVIDLDPARPDGYLGRAEAWLAAGKAAEAVKDLEVAPARDERCGAARLALGRALEALLDHEAARAAYEPLLRDAALAVEAHTALGRLGSLEADPLECAALARAMTATEGVAMTSEALDALARRLADGKRAAARASFGAALATRPDHAPALLGRARLSISEGLWGLALADLDALRDAPAHRAEVEALAGAIALGRQELAEAKRRFAAARAAAPDRPSPLVQSGLAALHREGLRHAALAARSWGPQDRRGAHRAFARALLDDPLAAAAALERGRLFAAAGRWDEALAWHERAAALDPAFAEAHAALGWLLARDLPVERRDGARAEAAFERALQLGAGAPARHGRGLARLLRGADRRTEARDDLRAAAAAAGPADAPGLHRLVAEACRRLGDEKAAAEAARRADEAAGAAQLQARARLREALELRAARDYPAAIARLDEALSLDPELGEAYQERGTCHMKLGSFIPGALDLGRAVEVDPRLFDAIYLKIYHISYIVDLDRVIAAVDEVVRDNPPRSWLLWLRGLYRFCKTEFKRFGPDDVRPGIADLDACLELKPDHVTAFIVRAALRQKLAGLLPVGDAARAPLFAKADADLDQALRLDPGSGLVPFLQALGWCLRVPDAPDEATRAVRRARAMDALRASLATGFKALERAKTERGFDAVRGEPGFQGLLQQQAR